MTASNGTVVIIGVDSGLFGTVESYSALDGTANWIPEEVGGGFSVPSIVAYPYVPGSPGVLVQVAGGPQVAQQAQHEGQVVGRVQGVLVGLYVRTGPDSLCVLLRLWPTVLSAWSYQRLIVTTGLPGVPS
jgi:hypothetical protein